MLTSTFCHVVGCQREKNLWQKGIFDWDAWFKSEPRYLNLCGANSSDIFSSSRKAIARGDADWFASRLHKHEHWRIACTWPDRALFLDIETTGLSLYYDTITLIGWSIGAEYNAWVIGHPPDKLLAALADSPILITFNGTCFDLKFIARSFPEASLPPIHIDLRYFAKRVGLAGGQKTIEKEINFNRPASLLETDGESAPLLWHQYIRGDKSALLRLAEYNHADIEGMKAIMDVCVSRYSRQIRVPPEIAPGPLFSPLSSKFDGRFFENLGTPESKRLSLPSMNMGCLMGLMSAGNVNILGIDLVSSEERESGVCLLLGGEAKTFRIKSDAEVIQLALDNGITLVSIDSPLGIPLGRTSCFDDDPFRKEYGITRKCERILAKRGVHSYPCLIPSMQKLTLRGMNLAAKFRALGVPVIESFPGATQDILNIPRKQAGLPYLAQGLADFGIKGEFISHPVSHDELDAITCAVSGLFFWAGQFESLGDIGESQIIAPDTKADPRFWLNRIVIGISGFSGSGKTTLAQNLREHGFGVRNTSETLSKMLATKGKSPSLKDLADEGWELHKRAGWQRKLILETVSDTASLDKIIVDALRFPEDRATLTEAFGPAFTHVHLICAKAERNKRLLQRSCHLRSHPVENGIVRLAEMAEITLDANNDSKAVLAQLLESIYYANKMTE